MTGPDATPPADQDPSAQPGPPAAETQAVESPPAQPPAPPVGAPAAGANLPPGGGHDAARRAFFREFGRQAVTAVGQVAGMANIVSRTSSNAAANLLGLAEPPPQSAPVIRSARPSVNPVVTPSGRPGSTDNVYRSPYRIEGDELVMLDQRAIPESIAEVVSKRGSDIAYYLRIGVGRGGPLMAQVAAYGIALTAHERRDQRFELRDVELRRTSRALAQARPSSRLPAWAMERMRAVRESVDREAEGAVLAAALRAEADVIASEFQVHHSAIIANLVPEIPRPEDRPAGVLLHGDTGALAGGLIGTGLAAVEQLAQEGRDLKIFVTETRPSMDGARAVAWQLRQAGLRYQVVPDAAVAWLLAHESIDVILVGAEWIAMNGDVAGVVGSAAIADVVAAMSPSRTPRPRLLVCSVSAAIDPATADGTSIPLELLQARDMAAYLTGIPLTAAEILAPATDVMAADRIAALVTERGLISPLDPDSVARLAGLASELEPS